MGHHDGDNEYGDRDPWGRSGPRGSQRRQHRGGQWGGPWGGWAQWGEPFLGGPGRGGAPVPPPWLTGLFGLGRPEPTRVPRVRRGDVRAAILDILHAAAERDESPNGYQVIQQITERSGGAWRPSPGSVYPTVQQLQDEGLVELDEERGRRALRLTDEGRAWCADHVEETAAVWAPFDRGREPGDAGHGAGGRSDRETEDGDPAHQADLKAEIGQVMSAIWQIVTNGSDIQRQGAVDVLVEARRQLYGILADGPEATPRDD